jgi:hypothetical protein
MENVKPTIGVASFTLTASALVWASCGGGGEGPGSSSSVLWVFQAHPEVAVHYNHPPPVVGPDGTIYVGASARNDSGEERACLYAVGADGVEKTRLVGEGPAHAGIQVTLDSKRSIAYGVDDDGGFYVLSAAQKLHQAPPSSPRVGSRPATLEGPLAVSIQGTVYGGGDGGLYVISIGGTLPGEVLYPDRSVLRPTVGPDGTIYGVSYRGVHAIDLRGNLLWQSRASGRIAFGYEQGLVVAGRQSITFLSRDGETQWEYETDGDVKGDPLVDSRFRIYARTNYRLYALTPNGEPRWIFESPTLLTTSPVQVGENVVLGDVLGKLFALSSEGDDVWSIQVEEQPTTPALGPNGILYVLSVNGRLQAVKAPL